ncbi:MAG TPA: M48 family metallopeptidase [Dongiaceae bacterium]|nr:M48 family metallopeptidase [Dongiaceae bacterium]
MKAHNLRTRILACILALLLTGVFPSGAVTAGPELPDPGRPGMSKEEQEQLGLKAAAQVYKQMPVLPDSDPIARYVQDLGKRMVTVIPGQYSWPYQFHVIQQKEINAFALPGGPIFVNVGTITAADNEAQLAGVMAHEMSHVYMQHSAKAAPKQTFGEMLGALGGMLGGGVGSLARLGIQLGAGSLLLKYSRGDEAQADTVGAIIMYKAGYDPRAMAQFFQKIEQQAGSSGPQFLSDHPNPGNRVEAVDKEIADWPHKNFLQPNPEFAQIKQSAAKVRAYTAQQISDGAKEGLWARQNAQSGATPPNLPVEEGENSPAGSGGQLSNVSYSQVQPSGNFKNVRQNAFAIAAPENWQVRTNSQDGVLIAPAAGAAAGAIGYGVIVNTIRSNSASLDDATKQMIQSLQQSNPDLQPTEVVREIKVNGVSGRSAHLTGTSPVEEQGQAVREHDWLVTVPSRGGDLVYLIFISPERDFSQLRPTFERMLNSLQLQ